MKKSRKVPIRLAGNYVETISFSPHDWMGQTFQAMIANDGTGNAFFGGSNPVTQPAGK